MNGNIEPAEEPDLNQKREFLPSEIHVFSSKSLEIYKKNQNFILYFRKN